MILKQDPQANLPRYQAWISGEKAATATEKATENSFFPNVTIYLHATFPQLAVGTARVNVNWISPAGKPINSAEQVIQQTTPGPVTVSFWLSLTRSGAVTAMFSGKDYKKQVYGQWQAQLVLDGELLVSLPFVVREI
jgi:hypothetical protein